MLLRMSVIAGVKDPVRCAARLHQTASRTGGKAVRKGDLPTKVCAVCQRPFTWRKKWKDVWEDVRYCSERCRNQSKKDRAPPETPG